MRRISAFLFSTRLMAINILMFAVSIATATFIENDFGNETARSVVYNSWWFNLLLFIGIINLTGTIISNKLYRIEKLSIFLFHLAFLFILVGAAVTRFFGFEGYMHIRKGEASNQIISSNNYFMVAAEFNGKIASAEKQVYFSKLSRNYHKLTVRNLGEIITAECLQIIPNAAEKIVDDPRGIPMIELVVTGTSGRQSVILSPEQPGKIGSLLFSFNDSLNISGVNFRIRNSIPEIRAPHDFSFMEMASQRMDTLEAQTYHPLQLKALYNFDGLLVVPRHFTLQGRSELTTVSDENADQLADVMLLKVSSGSQSKTVRFYSQPNVLNPPTKINFDKASISVSFGPKMIQVPFSLKLNEFILERYPGSNSPSWFESRINVSDDQSGERAEQRIYMNNILKHRGYRFYQSSYDTDELGTVLSVNRDYAGTMITYAGYLLLAIGIFFSIMNKNSRFQKLSLELSKIKAIHRFSMVAWIIMASVFTPVLAAGELPDSVFIDRKHAERFGNLLIQDPGGRIKPVNTLSSELLRKVVGKTQFMGQVPDQIFLGMLAFPQYWQQIPMIKTGHPEIRKILNTQEAFISFNAVFNLQSEEHPYLLSPYVNEAFQKKPAMRNTFDNEIIRLDERINLCYQIYSGNLLRIFPAADNVNNTWFSPANPAGAFKGKDSLFVSSIIPLYLQSLIQKSDTLNTLQPDEALTGIHTFQSRFGGDIIPDPYKVKLEIMVNRINIFDRLGSAYGLVGFVLLFAQFISIFYPRLNIKLIFRITIFLIYVLFFVHLGGLISRWLISGHAPWSNGYESLVYIAFATVLAGLIFSRKSFITLSVTSLLAWLILFVAHLNWMDPEITNLVPVLKSYWLLIHVAIITASYGFLAMGALMAFLNLILMITQTSRNLLITGRIITEFSIVIEMTLIIGLYLLTIGTFLGGVWANESWGRYWGWDPKETWALVSILIYAFIAHMRLIPGLKGNYIFNLMALIGFGTIIMTYFGVNYYLSGLHSYAKGDPLPIPDFVYYTLAVIGLVAFLAWENQRKFNSASLHAQNEKKNQVK